jgi:hypothetical protein
MQGMLNEQICPLGLRNGDPNDVCGFLSGLLVAIADASFINETKGMCPADPKAQEGELKSDFGLLGLFGSFLTNFSPFLSAAYAPLLDPQTP